MATYKSASLWPKFIDFNRRPLLLTKAYFEIVQKEAVLSFLRTNSHFKIEKEKNQDCIATWLTSDGKKILGIVKVNKTRCVLECLTKERAEEGKQLLERSLKKAIRFRAYSLQRLKEIESNEEEELSLEEYLQYYYEKEWIKTPLAALDGKTPLECLNYPDCKTKLVGLINKLEATSNLPYDFNRLRCRLRLGCVYDLRVELEKYKLALQEQILIMLDSSLRLLRAIEKTVGVLLAENADMLLEISNLIDELTDFVVILDKISSLRDFRTVEKEINYLFNEIEENLLLFLDTLPQRDEIITLYGDEDWDHIQDVNEKLPLPLPQLLAREIMVNWRASAEEILLTPEMNLKTVLEKQPIEWIEAISNFLGVNEGCKKKDDHIQAITTFLYSKSNLKRLLNTFTPPAKELLNTVLEAGGFFPYVCLVKYFGNDLQDGFYWREKPPKSIIGVLRARGLLFVGHLQKGQKKVKIALIPADLRPLLTEVLN
jgi:hypothetical protein